MPAEPSIDSPGEFPLATVACFDPTTSGLPRRHLDDAANREFLSRLAAAGAQSLLIAASTGHGHLRTVDELEAWFRSSAKADIGGAVLMALLRPEDRPEDNARLLRTLAELHYAAVFIRPGTNLKPTADDEAVADNMRPLVEMADEAGLPVGLYSIPDVSGVPLTADAAARLVQGPAGERIVAVKVTEPDFETSTLRFLEHAALSHLKIVQGWDLHLARALRESPRCGVTSGPMSFAVYQYLHILQCARRGDWDEVAYAQKAVGALFASMQDDPRRFADLQRAKYIMGLGHPLTGEVSTPQSERVLETLEALARPADLRRLARSLDLMSNGPYHQRLAGLYADEQ
ncbi:MAG: dihydrodipicolinate synthase family protein [Pirellulales bacterium]